MLEFIKKLALQAGTIALADQLQLTDANIHSKESVLDLVTDTDRKVEQFIIGALTKQFPGCGIFGEETGKSHADSDLCFIIDPIDGTASFAHHLPNWCVSIGAILHGEPYAGVIYQPSMNKLYYAEKGKGAWCSGMPIHVSKREKLNQCIVSSGFACLRAQWKNENNLIWFSRIAPLVNDIRKFGSAALDCCQVADGTLDAYWELFLQPYDIGAGVVIAREAGATITDLRGKNDFPEYGFLVTNGLLHETMLPFFHDYKHLKN